MTTSIKKKLGQFYTTNQEYILQGINIPENIKNIIEPFTGNGDLLHLLIFKTPIFLKIFIYFFLPYIISYFSQSNYAGKLLVTSIETPVQSVYTLLYPNAEIININYVKDMIKILPNHIKYWSLNELSEIATYGQLNNAIENVNAQFNYNYAISFWLYIEPGQTTKTYSSLMNYGNKPNILYNSSANTISVVISDTTGPTSCKTSKYGCCDNTDIYKKDNAGTNCITKSCESSPFGCCAKSDGYASIYKIDKVGMNCPNSYETCGTSKFGCCSDGITARTDATGTDCADANECSKSQYGCCIDGITSKNDEGGSKCPIPCSNTPFGCCIDGKTSRIDAHGTNCNKTEFGYCDDGVTLKSNQYGTNCAEKIIDGITKDGSDINIDENGNRILHIQPNILLQKWNNITMNYQGGTLDIFYNGELVKSCPGVVQFMTTDNILSVGDADNINGQISNLIYFTNPLNLVQINQLYNLVKREYNS